MGLHESATSVCLTMARVMKRFIVVILSRIVRLSRMLPNWLYRAKAPLFPDKKKRPVRIRKPFYMPHIWMYNEVAKEKQMVMYFEK